MSQALNRSLSRSLRAQPKRLEDMVYLSDASAYKVLKEADFQKMMELLDARDFADLHSGKVIRIDPVTRRGIAEAAETPLEYITLQMAYNVSDQADLERTAPEVVDIIRTGAIVDFDHVADRIQAVLDKFPETDLIDVVAREEGLVLYARSASATVQNLVEYDPDIDFDQPLVMTYLGERRARDVMAPWLLEEGVEHVSLMGDLARLDHDHEGVVPNPKIHHYKLMTVTQPRIKRYRAINE